MAEVNNHTITALVQDKPGVLARVAGLFSRRGFNISNLAVGHSETAGLSRMTFVVQGDEWVVERAGYPKITVIDTPGIGEVDGHHRGELALDAARRADLVLFVAEKDLTRTEFEALRRLHEIGKPLVFVINKKDNYTGRQQEELRASAARRLAERRYVARQPCTCPQKSVYAGRR